MTNEDITNYQKNSNAFRQTNIGKLFYQYVTKQHRAERYDAQMEFTSSVSCVERKAATACCADG